MSAHYPIRAVARLTGLSVDVLRAWERRYRVITPERGNGGRLYSDADVHRLCLLRQGQRCGYSIGYLAELSEEQIQELLKRHERENTVAATPAPAPMELLHFVAALEAYDVAGMEQELARLALLLPPRELVFSALLPLARLLEQREQEGTLPAAQVRIAALLLRNLLGSLLRLQRGGQGSLRLLLATPVGEPREFETLAAAVLAAGAPCETVYLGAQVPAEELLQAALHCRADAVLLGVSVVPAMATPPLEAGGAALPQLAQKLPRSVELWLLGRGAEAWAAEASLQRPLVLADLAALELQLRRLVMAHASLSLPPVHAAAGL